MLEIERSFMNMSLRRKWRAV